MRLDVVAKLLDLHPRKLLVEALDFLQAKNVGLNLLEIGEEVRQPLADGIDVPGGDAQAADSLGRLLAYIFRLRGGRVVRLSASAAFIHAPLEARACAPMRQSEFADISVKCDDHMLVWRMPDEAY